MGANQTNSTANKLPVQKKQRGANQSNSTVKKLPVQKKQMGANQSNSSVKTLPLNKTQMKANRSNPSTTRLSAQKKQNQTNQSNSSANILSVQKKQMGANQSNSSVNKSPIQKGQMGARSRIQKRFMGARSHILKRQMEANQSNSSKNRSPLFPRLMEANSSNSELNKSSAFKKNMRNFRSNSLDKKLPVQPIQKKQIKIVQSNSLENNLPVQPVELVQPVQPVQPVQLVQPIQNNEIKTLQQNSSDDNDNDNRNITIEQFNNATFRLFQSLILIRRDQQQAQRYNSIKYSQANKQTKPLNQMARKRILNELNQIKKHKPQNWRVQVDDSDFSVWKIFVQADSDSPFYGKQIELIATFPSDYPSSPSKLRVKKSNLLLHPNINGSHICEKSVTDSIEKVTIRQKVNGFINLLSFPNEENPYMGRALDLYRKDRHLYFKEAVKQFYSVD